MGLPLEGLADRPNRRTLQLDDCRLSAPKGLPGPNVCFVHRRSADPPLRLKAARSESRLLNAPRPASPDSPSDVPDRPMHSRLGLPMRLPRRRLRRADVGEKAIPASI
jgi:hypothetical protein